MSILACFKKKVSVGEFFGLKIQTTVLYFRLKRSLMKIIWGNDQCLRKK